MKCFELDWSKRPTDPDTGYIFSEEDRILGDFGDHILVSCLLNDEDYIITYEYDSGRKVLNKKAKLVR